MFGLFTQRRRRKRIARAFYNNAALAGRQPYFYAALNVPDTIDGRFEMIGVHVALYINRLNALERPDEAQATFDAMFSIMEKSIREIGVGDLSVPKHMKRMMKGFKGRAMNYIDALKQAGNADLTEAVKRNVYATTEEFNDNHVQGIVDYIRSSYDALEKTDYDDLIDFDFETIVQSLNEAVDNSGDKKVKHG
ncbi:MAG: ubiquinol-cytochrome C chaperone family protein [Pseudomonadota bacterium]